MAVTETVEHTVELSGGREYPVTITRRIGLDTYINNGKEIQADRATFYDYGPKQGVTRCYTLHKDYTPEERAEGRRHIRAVAVQAMIDQGIW